MSVAVRTADAVTRVILASRAAATGTTWLAVDEDVVIGFAALHGRSLEHLHVRPDRRGEGAGRLLLDTVMGAGPDGLTLVVLERNTAARAFYEAAGFRVLETRDGSGNEEGLPDLRYGWTPAAAPPG